MIRTFHSPSRLSGVLVCWCADSYRGEAPRYTTKEPTRQIIPKSRPLTIPSGPDYEDDDEEFATAPIPERGADGRLIFEGRWKGVFGPNLTPKEMFDGGAFGGGFFTSVTPSPSLFSRSPSSYLLSTRFRINSTSGLPLPSEDSREDADKDRLPRGVVWCGVVG